MRHTGDSTLKPLEREVAGALEEVNGPIVAGVSGGADSVALLRALCSVGRAPIVVTCDFHLRGDESTRDHRFVVDLCDRLGVECIEGDMDVTGYMRRVGGSVEMACRELRYELFRRVMRERGASRIAVAHNSDDNAETLFLNLMRTTGVEGLRGMLPDTGEIIRPLLAVSRTQIEAYLQEIDQEYVTDSTNLSDDYRRNFIRNKVLPLLETRWPGARRAIAATQRNLRGEARVVEAAAAGAVCRGVLRWESLTACGDRRTMIQRFAARAAVSASQIEEMTAHSRHPVAGKVWRGRTGTLRSEREGLTLQMHDEERVVAPFRWFRLPMNEATLQFMRRQRTPLVAFLSVGEEEFVWRTPEGGDRIMSIGMKGTQSVAAVLKDAHVAHAQRALTPMLVDSSGRIVWIAGVKRSRLWLVNEDAPYIYAVSNDEEVVAQLSGLEMKK